MDELSQELKDFVDGVRQEKIDDGASPEEATQATVEWLQGLANYLEKHKNND